MTHKPQKKKTKWIYRHGRRLPRYCECGGLMEYAFDFGCVFSCCSKCTPITTIDATLSRKVE